MSQTQPSTLREHETVIRR